MKRILIGSIITVALIVLSSFTSVVALDTPKIKGNGEWLYVGGTGEGNYSKIRDAIANATDGDTVFVYSGIYNETGIRINKSISIIGEDRDTTIIDGRGSGNIFYFECDSINISGFTIEDGGWSAIHMEGDSNNNISRNKFQRMEQFGIFGARIKYNSVDNNIIKNNIFISCNQGIFLYGNNNIVQNNTLTNNRIGMYIGLGGNFIIGNKIISNDKGVFNDGSNVYSWNNVSYNNIGFYVRYGDNIITHNNFFENKETLRICGGNSNVSYNNFIGSEIYHAKFTIRTQALFFIEFCKKFIRQIHNWDNNYWDDIGYQQKKIINGVNVLSIFSGSYIQLNINFPTKDFDYSPAQEPYDI